MEASSSFKQSLLKHMLVGLQAESSSGSVSLKSSTSLLERKRAIKLSADIAMAFARGSGASWSRALIADFAGEVNNKTILRSILGRDHQRMANKKNNIMNTKIQKSKGILKRSLRADRRMKRIRHSCATRRAPASHIARRMVTTRTRTLKSLVPGGSSLVDYQYLLGEVLDYVISLRAQVDVMRSLVDIVELFNVSSCPLGGAVLMGSCGTLRRF